MDHIYGLPDMSGVSSPLAYRIDDDGVQQLYPTAKHHVPISRRDFNSHMTWSQKHWHFPVQ